MPTVSHPEIVRVQAERAANRDVVGRIKNQALDQRLQAEERRAALAALNMQAETPGDRYAATTGELLSWLQETTR